MEQTNDLLGRWGAKWLQPKPLYPAYCRRVAMRTRVQKWGNSLGVRIPRGLAEAVGLGAGTEVSLTAKDGELIVKPARPTRLSLTDAYVPDRGDLVWLEFTPQTGCEQAGRRPALVISPKVYNAKVGLALFCPVTSRVKGYPFEVVLLVGGGVIGVVLADQLKSLDWRAGRVKLIERASSVVLAMVTARILPLLIPDNAASL